jgi:hypothetical protein
VELRDDVIVLRHWRADDAEAVYNACQDLDMLRWLPAIPRPYTREDARAFVMGDIGLGPHQFAIEKDGRVIGSIATSATGACAPSAARASCRGRCGSSPATRSRSSGSAASS